MAITAEQFKEAARKAAAARDYATAKSLIAKAKAAEGANPQQPESASTVSSYFQDVLAGRVKPAERFGPQPSEEIMLRNKARQHYADQGAGMAAAGGYAQGGTFGFSDELTARLQSLRPGLTYDQALAIERGRLDAARDAHPVAAYGGEVLGAIASPAATIRGATGPARAGSAARAGALSGAAYGFGTGENGLANRARGAAASGMLGAGIGAGASAFSTLIRQALASKSLDKAIKEAAKNAPSTEALRAAGNAAYKAVDDAGVSINPSALQARLGGIADDLRNEGVALDVSGKVFPSARGVMEAADNFTAGKNTIPFKDVDILRRFMGHSAASNLQNKADTRLTTKAMLALDDTIADLKPSEVDAGDLEALQTMLPKAREIWARMSKSQKIDDAIEASQDYLSGAASGLRMQFARILKNPKMARGFNEAEKRAMRNVVRGTLPEQALHLAAGGMGRLMTAASGFAGGGIPGAAAGAGISMGLQKASEKIAMRNAELARAFIANGGKAMPRISALPDLLAQRLIMGASRPALPPAAQELQGLLIPQR